MNFKNLFKHGESGPILGQRHFQVFMLFSSIVVNYISRYSIGITVLAIYEEEREDLRYKWNEMDKSYVLSSFFWGYCLTQLPGGYICRRLGVKTTMFISTFGSAAANIFPPFFGRDSLVFCIIRAVQGLFQGFLFPAIHAHLGMWSPKSEHNRLGAITNSGIDFGTILAMYMGGILTASSWGWQSVSYFSAAIGLAWCVLWLCFGANTPKESKLISAAELNYIESSKVNKTMESKIPVPWKAIFTSWPFFALNVARSSESWGFNTLIAEIPSYMTGVLGLDMKSNAIFSSLPYLVMFCMAYVFLISSDRLMRYPVVTLGVIRKTFNSIAFFLPAIGLICLGFFEKDQKALAILFLTVSVGLNTGHTIGSALNTLDLSPNHAGILMGIVNTFANIVPIVTPIVVGAIVKDETDRKQWLIVFIITAAILALSNIFYIFVGSTELQPWDAPDFLTKNDVHNENNIPVEEGKVGENNAADKLEEQDQMQVVQAQEQSRGR